MPTVSLPDRPDVDQLRKQARELQRKVRAGDDDALAHLAEHLPGMDVADLPLHLAQLAIARHYGCSSWARLTERVDVVRRFGRAPDAGDGTGDLADEFLRLACLTYGEDDGPHRWRRAAELRGSRPGEVAATIHGAAAAGAAGVVERILAEWPDAVAQEGGPFGWSPLLYATASRVNDMAAITIVRSLLEAGADPNDGYLWHGVYPFTALTGVFGGGELGPVNQPPHLAAEPLARLLLDAGADPNDSQALYNRMFEPGDDHLELLFRYGLGRGDGGPWRRRIPEVVAAPAELMRIQLEWAIAHGFRARVALLLDHGVDPNLPLPRGMTPLELAVVNGESEIAALLQAKGATTPRLDAVDEFIAAAMAGDRDAIRPAVVERARATRPGLVVWAASRGRTDTVRLLIESGWDVNAYGRGDVPVEDGWQTALHTAAGQGNIEMVDLLLHLGADPNLRDTRFDGTALGWARHGGHADVIARLEPLMAT